MSRIINGIPYRTKIGGSCSQCAFADYTLNKCTKPEEDDTGDILYCTFGDPQMTFGEIWVQAEIHETVIEF